MTIDQSNPNLQGKKINTLPLVKIKKDDPIWNTIHWDLNDAEIKKTLNCAATSVQAARRRLAPNTCREILSLKLVLNTQTDWTKTNAELATKFNCTASAVRSIRNKLAPETVNKRQQIIDISRKNYHLLDGMDWKRPNMRIAEELGISVTTTAKLRIKQAPETVGYHWKYSPTHFDWKSVDWSLSSKQLAKIHGMHHNLFTYGREVHAPATIPIWRRLTVQRWKDVDWSRPTAEIAEEMKTCYLIVAYRKRIYAPGASFISKPKKPKKARK